MGKSEINGDAAQLFTHKRAEGVAAPAGRTGAAAAARARFSFFFFWRVTWENVGNGFVCVSNTLSLSAFGNDVNI